jgi:hypothetical protein
LIFAKGDIQGPMEGILDTPVAAYGFGERLGVQCQAGEVIAAFDGAFPLDAPDGFDHANALKVRPSFFVLEPVDIGGLPVAARFDPSMVFLHGLKEDHGSWVNGVGRFGGTGRDGVGEEFLDFVVGGGVVAFEGQDIVGLLGDDFGRD